MKPMKHKKLFQGMGIGYLTCLITHVVAAVIPMYIALPFAQRLFGGGDTTGYQSRLGCHLSTGASETGLFSHILGDLLVLTLVIIPISVGMWFLHQAIKRLFVSKKFVSQKTDHPAPCPCDTCEHRRQ